VHGTRPLRPVAGLIRSALRGIVTAAVNISSGGVLSRARHGARTIADLIDAKRPGTAGDRGERRG